MRAPAAAWTFAHRIRPHIPMRMHQTGFRAGAYWEEPTGFEPGTGEPIGNDTQPSSIRKDYFQGVAAVDGSGIKYSARHGGPIASVSMSPVHIDRRIEGRVDQRPSSFRQAWRRGNAFVAGLMVGLAVWLMVFASISSELGAGQVGMTLAVLCAGVSVWLRLNAQSNPGSATTNPPTPAGVAASSQVAAVAPKSLRPAAALCRLCPSHA